MAQNIKVTATLVDGISPKTKLIKNNIKKDFNGAQASTNKLQKGMSSLGGAIGIGVAVLAFNKLNTVMNEYVDLAKKQQIADIKTEAILKATGHAAGLTAAQLKKMAGGLQELTTYGDESVQEAQNLLLTFKKIGGDVFPEVTKTALDMSSVLGQDLKSSAVQLGKALNDPINGASALKRVGVSLEDQQIEQIKTLMSQNKLYEAQRVILDELKSEFGGVADAIGALPVSQIDKLDNKIGDLKETIGTRFIPVIVDMKTAFLDALTFIDKVQKGAGNLGRILAGVPVNVLNAEDAIAKFIKEDNLQGIEDVGVMMLFLRDQTEEGSKAYNFYTMAIDKARAAQKKLKEEQEEIDKKKKDVPKTPSIDQSEFDAQMEARNKRAEEAEAFRAEQHNRERVALQEKYDWEISRTEEMYAFREKFRQDDLKADADAAEEKRRIASNINMTMMNGAISLSNIIGMELIKRSNDRVSDAESQKKAAKKSLLINAAMAHGGAAASIWTGPGLWPEKLAESIVVSANLFTMQGIQLAAINKAETGANFVTNGPRLMMVGDNAGGREQVSVTPIGTPNANGPQGGNVTADFSVHISGSADSNTVSRIENNQRKKMEEFKGMIRELRLVGEL